MAEKFAKVEKFMFFDNVTRCKACKYLRCFQSLCGKVCDEPKKLMFFGLLTSIETWNSFDCFSFEMMAQPPETSREYQRSGKGFEFFL